MYESFFEFDQRPFPAAPLTSRYFAGTAIESARQTMIRCLDRAEGAALLVGPAGAGKTLLCYLLAEHFRSRFAVAMLFSGRLSSRRDLLQAILYELNLPYRGMEEGELRLSLIDFLTRGERCPHGMLLLADEAHSLPLKLLDELRMITNVVRQGQPRVRLALSGNAALEERFASPKLESFSQRIAARCYLEPLSRPETTEYVKSQLAAVSGDAERIFMPEAFEAVHRATDGVPRLINQLCDHALLLAGRIRCRTLDARAVEKAWAHLQQLPLPRDEGSPTLSIIGDDGAADRRSDIVEFGSLDDEPYAPLHIIDDLIVPGETDELTFAAETAPGAAVDVVEPTDLDLDEPNELPEPETYESVPRYEFQSLLSEPEQPMLSDFSEFAAESPEVELVFDEEPAAEQAIGPSEPGVADDGGAGSPLWPDLVSAEEAHVLLERHASAAKRVVLHAEELESHEKLPELTDLPELQEQPWQFAEPEFVETAVAPSETWSHPEQHLAASEGFDLSALDKIEICIEPCEEQSRECAAGEDSLEEEPQEELVVDRYAAIELHRGRAQGTQLLAPVAKVETVVERSREVGERTEDKLALAEALMRQAAAVEHIGGDAYAAEFGSVMAVQESLACDLPGTWQSVDLLPAAGELPECATSETVSCETALPEPTAKVLRPHELADRAEPDLIVVEDDLPSAVRPAPSTPIAAPVRRQEYKQLFAKLRKN